MTGTLKCCCASLQCCGLNKGRQLLHQTSQCDQPQRIRCAVMMGQQKLLSLWVCLLLVAALCPGAHYAHGKRGGRKSNTNKGSQSQGRGPSKQGLKWAGLGAAAAGVLGGTGTGYGLGLFGRPKQGSASHQKTVSTQHDHRLYLEDQQRFNNQSLWRGLVSAAAPPTHGFLSLGHVVSVLIAAWIRDMSVI